MNSSRRLVGREPLLAIAGAHLDDLEESRGGLLLLAGEPGIGKTRLAEEIAARARERGAVTAWATAWQGDGAPSLWPWVQILRQLTGSADALAQPQPELSPPPTAGRSGRRAIARGDLDRARTTFTEAATTARRRSCFENGEVGRRCRSSTPRCP